MGSHSQAAPAWGALASGSPGDVADRRRTQRHCPTPGVGGHPGAGGGVIDIGGHKKNCGNDVGSVLQGREKCGANEKVF